MPSDFLRSDYTENRDMKEFDAQLILMCRTARTTSQVWEMLRRICRNVTYNYVNGTLSGLFRAGMMLRRSHGRPTYYISTEKAVLDVVSYLNNRYNERVRESAKASGSMDDNRVLTEFLKA